MRFERASRLAAILLLGLVSLPFATSHNSLADVSEVVDKTAQRLASYPEMTHWQASILSTNYEMDGDWNPKKKTVVQKTVIMKDKIRQEKIKDAVEIKDGKSKDVTQKFINEAYKNMQKAAKRRKKANENNGEENGSHRMDLSLDEMFPFSEKNRENYDFALLDATTLEGIPVVVLEATAKQRTEDFFEGVFYIDLETWDVVRAELRLAKNPGPLKVMEMSMDFLVIPEGYFVLRKMTARVHVGLIVKNIRREVVDEYSDYQILK